MARNPSVPGKFISRGIGTEAIRHALFPLSNYSRCESPAFVRRALAHAIAKDLAPVSPYADAELIPSSQTISLGLNDRRSQDALSAIKNKEDIEQAAAESATQLKKSRLFFEQAQIVGEEIKPILYYYGGIYFMDFVCLNLVRREPKGGPGHGLSVTTDSKGWDFDKNWPRSNCRVKMEATGDFPFYIDAMTVSGRPTLLSGFRLHQDTKTDPWAVRKNPAPLLVEKVSFDLLCNFDKERYLRENPEVDDWLVGSDKKMIWKLTNIMLDLIVIYVAASLARYYTPAWTKIIEASKSDIYNDVRAAYHNISEGLMLFFEDEYPFQYSYGTRIPPY